MRRVTKLEFIWKYTLMVTFVWKNTEQTVEEHAPPREAESQRERVELRHPRHPVQPLQFAKRNLRPTEVNLTCKGLANAQHMPPLCLILYLQQMLIINHYIFLHSQQQEPGSFQHIISATPWTTVKDWCVRWKPFSNPGLAYSHKTTSDKKREP